MESNYRIDHLDISWTTVGYSNSLIEARDKILELKKSDTSRQFICRIVNTITGITEYNDMRS